MARAILESRHVRYITYMDTWPSVNGPKSRAPAYPLLLHSLSARSDQVVDDQYATHYLQADLPA